MSCIILRVQRIDFVPGFFYRLISWLNVNIDFQKKEFKRKEGIPKLKLGLLLHTFALVCYSF
ncbi:MAG: hypothetical protein DRR19_17750 [Candidatus Parabeggiatoa sp. nov. 1]|nr:MAG: hypothetical protein DRR19_17750 [Gammaproteobacteria bacterium]